MVALAVLEPPLSESAPTPRRRTPTVPLDQERAVVARLRDGDRAALAILYRWYGDAVYRAALSRLPDPTLAEDVLRDTFRTALEKLDRFTSHDRSIFFWLRRIAVNKAIDVHRRRRRERELSERVLHEPTHASLAQAPPAPDRGLEADDAARDVEACLGRINPRYAHALRLRLLQDRPREECAEALGVSVANFDVILHRASKAFRKVYPP